MGDDFSFYNNNDTVAALLLFSHRIDLAGSIIFTVISIVGIIANGLVVFKVARHKHLWTKNNFFIANLAAADTILFLSFIIPTDINTFTELNPFRNKQSMVAIQYVQHVCIQATAIILCFMSFSRFTMAVYPLKAKASWTSVKVWICCAASWLVSTLIYIPILYGILYTPQGHYHRVDTKVFSAITMLLLFVVPFCVIVFCYAGIIISFRMGHRMVRRNSNINEEMSAYQSRKLTRMVLIIIIVFFVSWAPVESYLTWLNCRVHNIPTSPANWRHIEIFGFCARLTAYIGSAVNPFIYAFANPSFKNSNMFRLRRRSPTTVTMTTGVGSRYEPGSRKSASSSRSGSPGGQGTADNLELVVKA